jgi:hypothetical protein
VYRLTRRGYASRLFVLGRKGVERGVPHGTSQEDWDRLAIHDRAAVQHAADLRVGRCNGGQTSTKSERVPLGIGTFHMINISGNALAAHIAHGDHLGTAGNCGTNLTKVAAGASASTYSGGVLSVALTVYKTAGVYSGTGSHYYTKDGRTYNIAIAHACINKTAKTVTVWGPGTSNQSPVTGFGMSSLKGNGTSMGTRGVFGSSLASLPTTQQCSASPLFSATGTGFLTFW